MSKVKTCAFARADKCFALTNKFCKECSFFKTAEELEKSRKQTEKRITSLPRLMQSEIRSKYYAKKVMGGVGRNPNREIIFGGLNNNDKKSS